MISRDDCEALVQRSPNRDRRVPSELSFSFLPISFSPHILYDCTLSSITAMNPHRNPPHMLFNNPYLTQGNTTSRPLPTYRSAHQQPRPSGNTNLPVQTSPSHSLLQTPDVLIRVTDTNTNLSTTHSSGGTSAASFDPYGQFGPKSSATGLSSLRPQRHSQPISPVPHLPNAHLVPGLLAQRIFTYSRLDYRPLASQEADFLKRAIRIAHRLVFSAKSIDVLHYIISGGSRKDPNRTPELVSYFSALAQNDGMSVILDCEWIQAGFINALHPRMLRISATVSLTGSRCTCELTSTAVRTSDTRPKLW